MSFNSTLETQTGAGVRGHLEGKDWESVIGRCKPLFIEWINKVLLYSTGTHIQHSVINCNGKEHEKEYICV